VSEWEPYVRIWQEVDSDREVAMLLADDYRSLCRVTRAAIEFVRHHEIGQPRVQGTIYPMTIGQEEAWNREWDEMYATLKQATEALTASRMNER
jgi:hypothetical protein